MAGCSWVLGYMCIWSTLEKTSIAISIDNVYWEDDLQKQTSKTKNTTKTNTKIKQKKTAMTYNISVQN